MPSFRMPSMPRWHVKDRFRTSDSSPDRVNIMSQSDHNNVSDVLPPPGGEIMALMWLLLFGGRWLLFPVLQASGVLTPQAVTFWDEAILLKLYLVLLVITCVVLALRAVRNSQPGTKTMQVEDGYVSH